MIRINKISGESLSPEYKDGDFVVSSKIPIFFNHIRPGDVVIFGHKEYGVMIKQVGWLKNGGERIFVIGTGSNSIDSRGFGLINKSDLIGKVILHIRKPHQVRK